jgi:hypothetical protein
MIYLIAGLTAAQLADCSDAQAYADSVHAFLWGGVFPAILTFSASRLIINILYSLFSNV